LELQEAIELIKPAFTPPQRKQVWAELGCGKGLFTYALATLLGSGSIIHAVDTSRQIIKPSFNGNRIVFHPLDFSEDILPFAQLDGILMANSMHFVEDKRTLLSRLRKLLRGDGQLVIIEYELDIGNAWVPHPVPQAILKAQLAESGFTDSRLVGERQSVYGGRKMYACVGVNGKK
jgi:SAM-dependent methyltransferase